MENKPQIPPARDKLLFTPGPLTTSQPVKQAMLRDAGSWHYEFNNIVRAIREKLLHIAGVGPGFEAVLMQGSGTFGVEAVLATVVHGKLLALSNGAYGERIVQMAAHLGIETVVLRSAEDQTADLEALRRMLADDPHITHVAVVHCETTTGILNPIDAIGRLVKERPGRTYIVDAMSSFGAVPINFEGAGIDFLISSANKCLEGVPGFSFVIGRRDLIMAAEGKGRSLSLDLVGQLKGFDKNGQFRYTPPTHAVLAFEQALREFDAEGGISARSQRYRTNHSVLMEGMNRLGFKSYLPAAVQSYIITSFHFPRDPRFQFTEFYRRLAEQGMIIYPGKLSQVDTFRIGSIGRLFEGDMRALVAAVRETLEQTGWQV